MKTKRNEPPKDYWFKVVNLVLIILACLTVMAYVTTGQENILNIFLPLIMLFASVNFAVDFAKKATPYENGLAFTLFFVACVFALICATYEASFIIHLNK